MANQITYGRKTNKVSSANYWIIQLWHKEDRERQNRAEHTADGLQRIFLAELAEFREGITDCAGERFFDQLIRDIPLATSNGFGRSAVPNWGRTDHGNATKHRNQTEVEVVCRIVKRLNAEDGMGTYERLGRILYSRAEKRKLGRLNIEWLNYGELRICETHMSLLAPDAAKMMPEGQSPEEPEPKRAVVFDSWSAGWWDNHGAYTQKPCATPAPLPMVLNEEYRSTLLALKLNALYAATGYPGEQASELASESVETANRLNVDTLGANVTEFGSPQWIKESKHAALIRVEKNGGEFPSALKKFE
ncbi:hypothetical protein V8E52_005230 [Russula decolorans]